MSAQLHQLLCSLHAPARPTSPSVNQSETESPRHIAVRGWRCCLLRGSRPAGRWGLLGLAFAGGGGFPSRLLRDDSSSGADVHCGLSVVAIGAPLGISCSEGRWKREDRRQSNGKDGSRLPGEAGVCEAPRGRGDLFLVSIAGTGLAGSTGGSGAGSSGQDIWHPFSNPLPLQVSLSRRMTIDGKFPV